MKMNTRFLLFYLLLISCDDSNNSECLTESNGRGKILSVLPLGNISSTFLSDFLIENNIDIGINPKNDVKVYSIVYQTIDWNNVVRQASGAIYIPNIDGNKKFPIYSGQHGTESKRSNVASITPLRGFDAIFMASVGYIGSSPDLLGLGVSDDVVHPYVHKDALHRLTLPGRVSQETILCTLLTP